MKKTRLYTARAIFALIVFLLFSLAVISGLVAIKAFFNFDFYVLVGATFTIFASFKIMEKAHKKLEMEEDRFYSTFDFSF